MKKIIYILSIFLATGFISCDNFLDITPVGKVIPTTATEFRALMTQAYVSTPKSGRARTAFRSDEVGSFTDTESRSLYFEEWTWDDYSPDYSSDFGWRQYYQALFLINYTIENENKMTGGSKEEIAQLVGEAYAMRAYIHFMLVNLYGKPYNEENLNTKAVPLKLNSNTEDAPSRNTVAEIYAAIESDIVEAGKRLNVEKWDVGFNYRFTTTALKAFRSRLYLYMQKWSESLNASKEVLEINKELVDLSQTTMPNNYQSVESIMALEYSSADINRAIYISTDLYNLYNSNDYRRKNRFYTSEGGGRYTVRKGGSNEYACTFRTGEIYLNAAEAACQDDNLIDAKDYLLQLKAKRFNATGYAEEETKVEAMDKDELLQEIYDERYRELAFEGHRWFDLRRTTQPAITKTENEKEYKLEQSDERYTIRIPNEAIQSNPNLTN